MATDAQGRLLSDDGNYYWDGSNWQLVAPTPQSPQERAADLDRNYQGWLAEGNYSEAAESLNGFNLDDINSRLARLTPQQIAELHQAAVSNPHLGPSSNVALVTGVDSASDGMSWWQKNEGTVWEIAQSKGLVLIGEQFGAKAFPQAIGAKLGGIIGWAIDFALSPGGDTMLPHTVYQASVDSGGIPVPCTWNGQIAQWHRKRENAQKEAHDYTAQTGEQAIVNEDYSKDPNDPD